MRTENVRDVRGCKRYLLHPKPLYSKALRAYLVDVRVISNIGGEESIYTHRQALPLGPISISYTYILAICIINMHLGRKR